LIAGSGCLLFRRDRSFHSLLVFFFLQVIKTVDVEARKLIEEVILFFPISDWLRNVGNIFEVPILWNCSSSQNIRNNKNVLGRSFFSLYHFD
jgi:hypothetical protein